MPLYEYRCADCGHELEVLRKISDPAPVNCPACQHPALHKKLSAAGFQLKGTGWYVTDFRGGGGASAPATAARAGDAPADSGKPGASPGSGDTGGGGAATPTSTGPTTPAAGSAPATVASSSSNTSSPPSNA